MRSRVKQPLACIAILVWASACLADAQTTPSAVSNTTATAAPPIASASAEETTEPKDIRAEYFLEKAQSWYEYKSGNLSWRSPAPGETHYLGLRVTGLNDERVLPGCNVLATIVAKDAARESRTTAALPLQWTPKDSHYGVNLAISPDTRTVGIEVRIEPPSFARQDKEKGAFFTRPAVFSWKDVAVPPGGVPQNGDKESTDTARFGPGRYAPLTPTPYPGSAK